MDQAAVIELYSIAGMLLALNVTALDMILLIRPRAKREKKMLDSGGKVPTRSWGSTAASEGFIYCWDTTYLGTMSRARQYMSRCGSSGVVEGHCESYPIGERRVQG